MKFTKTLSLIVLNLSLLWLFSITVSACSCYSTLPCQAYSRADRVFIGKLEKLEKIEKSFVAQADAYFTVERMFKGDFRKEIIVTFETGCRPPFIVGETYFVYDDSGQMYNMCNRTSGFYEKYSKNNLDLKYAESLSAEEPRFSILGQLSKLSESELKQTIIEIADGERAYKISPAKSGSFEFLSYTQNSHRVKITVPFLAEVFPGYQASYPDFITSQFKTQTSVEYKVNFQTNGCSYVDMVFNKTPEN